MRTGSAISVNGKWGATARSDVRSLVLVTLMGLLFSLALVMAVVHPTSAKDADVVAFSGP